MIKVCFASSVLGLLVASNVYAQSNDVDYQSRMTALSQYVTTQCDKVKLAGTDKSEKIAADAGVELKGVLSKLANPSLKGKGSYEANSYSGLERGQLVDALKNESGCKENMTKMLLPAFFPTSQPSRDPNELYQYDRPVGDVMGTTVSKDSGTVIFDAIKMHEYVNYKGNFQFQNMTLQCPTLRDNFPETSDPEHTIRGMTLTLVSRTVCKIQ
ncbi:hypothetical protein ACLEIY_02095 [Acetobacter tropicalis]|uniref:hypothetical protein n=1 Tax=Acetobacter tropicalis TaxID=104102 RepID=UPI0039751B8C